MYERLFQFILTLLISGQGVRERRIGDGVDTFTLFINKREYCICIASYDDNNYWMETSTVRWEACRYSGIMMEIHTSIGGILIPEYYTRSIIRRLQ